MNILIGCESSGTVREQFRDLGHNAWSCDLLPADDGSKYHIQGDILEIAYWGKNEGFEWDLMIVHPPCTYLTVSAAWAFKDGPYHQKVKPGTLVGIHRRRAREEALNFVQKLMDAPIPFICIENPVGAISTHIRPADQYIQPYQFGDDASKKTGLWLKNLTPLKPAAYCAPRIVNGKERWANQTDSGQNKLGPSADRWKTRSKTYPGIARAMAKQWNNLEDIMGDFDIAG